jgi:cell wall-associated NlpC family hydrolase
LITTGLSAALVVGGVSTTVASAAPRRDLQQVRDEVRTLQARSEASTERFNAARNELAAIEERLAGLERKVQRERAELRLALSSVEDLARAAYTSGGLDTSLHVLLSDDPVEFLAQAAALDQVARSQSSTVRRSQTTRLRLAQSEAAVADQQSMAKEYRDLMAGAKAESEERLDEAEGILAGLEADERRRLVALAEQERQDALAVAAAATAALNSGGTTGRPSSNGQASSGSSTSTGTATGPSSAGGGYSGGSRAAAAVSYALAQVGDRYVAAAAGPSAWDCSGLTMAAWRQAGVSLPHYSYSQYSSTTRIPLSEAQPGDLVFYFGGGVHHVGLYIGGGKMVHAANPGDGVLVTDILGPWYENYFSGIGRVV